MQTRFDDLTDAEIADAGLEPEYTAIPEHEHAKRILRLAASMDYWKAWLGPPVTFFDPSGLHFDGQHRTRAVKYVARQSGYQILIPVRYDPKMGSA